MPFDMRERSYESDLKSDLLMAQSRVPGNVAIATRARVSCSIASTSAERSNERCPPSPKARGLLVQSCLVAMTRQLLRLVLSNLGETALESFGDASV